MYFRVVVGRAQRGYRRIRGYQRRMRSAAQGLRRREAVRRWWLGREQRPPQRGDRGRNDLLPVAAGSPWLPAVCSTGSHGAQVRGIELIEASPAKAEFSGSSHGGERAFTEAHQKMPNEGGSMACSQLVVFFIAHDTHRGVTLSRAGAPLKRSSAARNNSVHASSRYVCSFSAHCAILFAPRQRKSRASSLPGQISQPIIAWAGS